MSYVLVRPSLGRCNVVVIGMAYPDESPGVRRLSITLFDGLDVLSVFDSVLFRGQL
jgi:hypothetical protein